MLTKVKNTVNSGALQDILQTTPMKIFLRLLHIGLVGTVFYLLIERIRDIGWQDVWAALPSNPVYYVFFLIWYFAIPVTELWVYRLMWRTSLRKHFAIFLRKRVYNLAFVSYSGEAVLAFWARGRFDIPNRKIYSTIKDSNVLSALSSNIFTIVALVIFFWTGQLSLIVDADPNYQRYIGLAVLVGLVLVPLILHFRNTIISLPPKVAGRIVVIHFCRFITMLICQMGMWWVVLPDVSFSTWLLFITAQLVLQRVPFLPNTDLLFLGLGLSMAHLLDAPEAVVAGMFLGAGALAQIFNLVIYLVTSFGTAKPPSGSMKDLPDDNTEIKEAPASLA